MEDIKLKIAKNLKKYRNKKGLTQAQLANELEKRLETSIKHNTISSWENGVNSIDINVIVEICNILGITPNEMYGVKESNSDENLIAANLKDVSPEKLERIKKFIEFTLMEDD